MSRQGSGSSLVILQTTILLAMQFVYADFVSKTPGKRLGVSNVNTRFSHWMEDLPESLHGVPLTNLAIPGSHDSCSYSISKRSAYSMGIDSKAKELFSEMDTASAQDILYRWSVTQSLNITEQLKRGIRYLDMRISYNQSNGEINVVHGLTGSRLDEILEQVKEFAVMYPKEAILMDFNHFYYDTDEMLPRKLLFSKVERYLGEHLCERTDLKMITLKYLWKTNKQILFFFSTSLPHLPNYVWRSTTFITAPFDRNTFEDPEKWIRFLAQNYDSRRPKNMFYVTQGILQPHWIEVLAGQAVNATLKTWMSQTANPVLVEWVKNRANGPEGINIVIADFIQTYDYVPTVLSLNNEASIFLFNPANLCVIFLLNVLVIGFLY